MDSSLIYVKSVGVTMSAHRCRADQMRKKEEKSTNWRDRGRSTTLKSTSLTILKLRLESYLTDFWIVRS